MHRRNSFSLLNFLYPLYFLAVVYFSKSSLTFEGLCHRASGFLVAGVKNLRILVFKKWIFLKNSFFLCSSCFSHVWLFATPWSRAHQAPLSLGFSRQEYWSGLPCLPPGHVLSKIEYWSGLPCLPPRHLPNWGIKLHLLHCRQILYHWATSYNATVEK